MEYISNSPKETMAIARFLANKFKRLKKSERAIVINLVGELGSGKTTFIKGFARELGVRSKIISPTFLIIRRFSVPRSKEIKNLYHIDAYRIKARDIIKLGFNDMISEPQNLLLIEWGDRLKKILPKQTLNIKFMHGSEETVRYINIK